MTELQRPVERWRARTVMPEPTGTPEPADHQTSALPFYMAFACGFITAMVVCSVIVTIIH